MRNVRLSLSALTILSLAGLAFPTVAYGKQELTNAASPPPAPPQPERADRRAGPDPQTLYNTAYNDYLKGSYDLAQRGFQQYLEPSRTPTWPPTPLESYEVVVHRYPHSDKEASALLKKGYAHLELGERAQGVAELQHVTHQFPTSDEANLARQKLRQIGVSG